VGLTLALLASLAAAILAASGAVVGAASDLTEGAGVYRRPLGHDPETLDPAKISDVYSRAIAQQIFDGLVQFDQTLTVVPALAQFWKASRDGLTWTFTLRKGVKFHHGREVTADDVVYSFTRMLSSSVRSTVSDLFTGIKGARDYREGRARTVSGLTAVDRHTVRVTLEEASVPFVSVLAVGHAKIVPRDLVEQQGEAFGAHPVGTGPFKFAQWERGKHITLAANPDYFEGPPRLRAIVYRIFPGEQYTTMYEEFRRGQLEDSPVPNRGYREIVAASTHVYVKRPMISLRFYGFNTRIKPFGDVRVRRAILHAINRAAMLEDLFLGRFPVANGILPPGTQGFNPNVRGIAYDPARARELLVEAGYPGGRGLPRLQIWSGAKFEAAVRELEQIQRYLTAVGISSDVHYQTDWPSYSKLLAEGKLPMFLYAWYADVPDPDNFLFQLFHSRSPRNFFGYQNHAVDDLLMAARAEGDPQRRVDLYRRAEQMIVDDAPFVPVMHHTYERVFQPYVRSVEVNGLGDPYIPLRKIWLERPH
jgi:peptide/nickel transport system substrate-binding protein